MAPVEPADRTVPTAGPHPDPAAPAPPSRPGPGHRRGHVLRAGGLVVAVLVLLLTTAVSIAVGTKSIPLAVVLDGLFAPDGSENAVIVQDYRLTRTLLGLAVGVGLGLAGALMQALTRNPLADPGLLGVTSGASAAVVLSMWVFGVTGLSGYVWFAFLGAAVTSLAVYALGTSGRGAASPVRLVLAGTAVNASLIAGISALTFLDRDSFQELRIWSIGSLAGRDHAVLVQVLPFLGAGALLALALAGPLNALALGDELGSALGARVVRTRVLGAVAITLLCGAATAAVGPIGFLGLIVPHAVRLVTGPDQRWQLPYCLVLSPTLLLASDVLGRVLVRPDELAVGIMTAALGAPVLIALVRRRKVPQL
ncbi:FecCD family ABC transporter permease [Kitasatospora sp. NPDC096147]|uniref:FecCD family ABC transporter permease n=1 Tax=Kitasatospora sp. NPDC096147 TaxID=3364093 RepID=UPI00381228A7